MSTGTRAVVLGAVLTGAFVAAGALIAARTVPHLDSPVEVTKAYASAVYDGDWPGVLEVVCASERDYYADRASWERPPRRDHKIDIGELQGVSVHGKRELQVPYKRSSEAGFLMAALVIQEDGRFQVCGMALDVATS